MKGLPKIELTTKEPKKEREYNKKGYLVDSLQQRTGYVLLSSVTCFCLF